MNSSQLADDFKYVELYRLLCSTSVSERRLQLFACEKIKNLISLKISN